MIKAGKAVVQGAVVRDTASGRIFGLLRVTKGLAETVAQVAPVPGMSLVSAVLSGVQNADLKSMLSTLETISKVGAMASVAGLVVSAVGFAVIGRKINRLSDDLKRVEQKVDQIAVHLQRRLYSDVRTAIQRCSDASYLNEASREATCLTESRVFHEYANFLSQSLFGDTPDALTPSFEPDGWIQHATDATAFRAALDTILMCHQAEIDALLLGGHTDFAQARARRVAEWIQRIAVPRVKYVTMRANNRVIGPKLQEQFLAEADELVQSLAVERGIVVGREGYFAFLQETGIEPAALEAALADRTDDALVFIEAGAVQLG